MRREDAMRDAQPLYDARVQLDTMDDDEWASGAAFPPDG